MDDLGTKDSCGCHSCRQACQYNPGWFLPGEVEQLAEALGTTVEELFEDHLCVDWWCGDRTVGDQPTVFVLTPAIEGSPPGTEKPADPRGRCVFYDPEAGCRIHETGAKPHECREYLHGQTQEETHERHRAVADAWRDEEAQELIRGLLGREPVEAHMSFGEGLSLMLGLG